MVRLAEAAGRRGGRRILAPANHATAVALTHVDAEKQAIPAAPLAGMVERIRAAPPQNVILSSDCGVFLLPPPVEGLREFVLLLEAAGLPRADIQRMIRDNPTRLFRVGERLARPRS